MRRFFLLLLCMAWPLSAEGQLSLDEVERLALGEPVLPSHIPSVLPSKTISLSGEWQLQGADMENSDICIKANIPCSIHKALITSGLLPDPMVGFNDTLAARRSYQGWKLTKTFTYDGCFVRPSLVFQGVANRCRVSLNGVRLGEHEGMLQRFYEKEKTPLRWNSCRYRKTTHGSPILLKMAVGNTLS